MVMRVLETVSIKLLKFKIIRKLSFQGGGPLMNEAELGNDKFILLGLVSFGPRQCGLSNFPGVYTRVSSYMEWILKNIEP
jgi:secreted trypsin-like serine protease